MDFLFRLTYTASVQRIRIVRTGNTYREEICTLSRAIDLAPGKMLCIWRTPCPSIIATGRMLDLDDICTVHKEIIVSPLVTMPQPPFNRKAWLVQGLVSIPEISKDLRAIWLLNIRKLLI